MFDGFKIEFKNELTIGEIKELFSVLEQLTLDVIQEVGPFIIYDNYVLEFYIDKIIINKK